MKYSIAVKATAIFLCALLLFAAAASGIGILLIMGMGITETNTVDKMFEEDMQLEWMWTAENLAKRYASRKLGGYSEHMADAIYGNQLYNKYRADRVFYLISDAEGNPLEGNYDGQPVERVQTIPVIGRTYYGLVTGSIRAADAYEALDLINARLTPEESDGVLLLTEYDGVYYGAKEAHMPDYNVTLYLQEGAMLLGTTWELAKIIWENQMKLYAVLGISLVLLAITVIYLCCAAGRDGKTETPRAEGLNRLPIDLYFLAAAGIACLIVFLLSEGRGYLLRQGVAATAFVLGYCGFACCLLAVGFCYAFVAQVKTPDWFWWRNSLTGRCCKGAIWCVKLAWKITLWTVKAVPVICLTLIRYFWGLLMSLLDWMKKQIGRFFGWVHGFYKMLPMTWQWLIAGGCLALMLLIAYASRRAFWVLLALAASAGLILYGANCFGTLLKSTKRMREGDLEVKVDEKRLVGSFRDFAEELNGLADVAVVAARKQLQSERMKTELITNVSHDIKTPLTSIINYVDLLQKAETPEERKAYLEILSRQSQRMKKLIEDLIEMSKASTGNMTVEITRIDGREALNQALGEFSDKLAAAQLAVVFDPPDEEVWMNADGRLLWRAMSNVLSNAVKYAMPGTRLYVDLSSTEEKVLISLKNISRDPLNISAEELMERFVRGDSSRNTEGSGLGLNIARSLMELQHGELQLLVDGDLFKVTLIFQRAK